MAGEEMWLIAYAIQRKPTNGIQEAGSEAGTKKAVKKVDEGNIVKENALLLASHRPLPQPAHLEPGPLTIATGSLGASDALDSIWLDEESDLGIANALQPTSHELPTPKSVWCEPLRARYEGTWRQFWLSLGDRREEVLIVIRCNPTKAGMIT